MKLDLLSFALVQQASCAVLHGRYGAIRSQDLTKELDSQSCVIQGSDADKARFDKRAVDSSCNRFQQDVQRAYEQCAKRARSGAAACKDSKRDDILKAVFHTTEQKARDIISAHLTQIADECDKKGKGITPLSCLGSGCKPGIAGVTMVWSNGKGGTNPITLCDIKETDDSCGGQDLGDVLLHEMSHSWGRTDDKCYGMAAIQDITSASSLNNADSYTRYAKAADMKCSRDAMMAPGTGGTTPPGTSPGQDDWQDGQDGQDDWQDGQDGQDGLDGISPGGGTPPQDDSSPGGGTPPQDDSSPGGGTPPQDDSSPGGGVYPGDEISPGTGTPPGEDCPPGEDGSNGPKIPPGTGVTPQPGTPSETGTPPGAGNPPQGSPTPWPGPGTTPVQDGQDRDNGNNGPVNPVQPDDQDSDNGSTEPVYPGEQVGEDNQNGDDGMSGPVFPPQDNQNGDDGMSGPVLTPQDNQNGDDSMSVPFYPVQGGEDVFELNGFDQDGFYGQDNFLGNK